MDAAQTDYRYTDGRDILLHPHQNKIYRIGNS